MTPRGLLSHAVLASFFCLQFEGESDAARALGAFAFALEPSCRGSQFDRREMGRRVTATVGRKDDVLRARNLSSERIATALMSSTATVPSLAYPCFPPSLFAVSLAGARWGRGGVL